MKRLLAILMIGCMLLPASCKKKQTTTTDDDTSTSKTSMEFLRQDYRLVTTRFPEAEGCMVQAQYRLNALVSEKKKAKETSDMLNMFYVKATSCVGNNGSKYFVVYLSKI